MCEKWNRSKQACVHVSRSGIINPRYYNIKIHRSCDKDRLGVCGLCNVVCVLHMGTMHTHVFGTDLVSDNNGGGGGREDLHPYTVYVHNEAN